MSAQRAIEVDPEKRIARVGPGVLLGELDRATQVHGLATPTGNVSMTGVAGLTLGGGLGWIARKHGPACDNLLAAEVVTADGHRVRASADENAGLLWGLRGGGGNFGVVTSFEYLLHPVGPEVLAGGVVHAFADAPELFRFLREFVAEAPDELSVTASTFRASAVMPLAPEMVGELVTVLAVCYAGDLSAGEEALRPLRSFGRPLLDGIAPMPYTALQSGSDASYPSGQHNYWKSHYLAELSDDAIATLIEHAPRMRSSLSSFYLQHLGGEIARPESTRAAFGHRDGLFDFAILTVWRDPAETAGHVAWARVFFDAMQPHAHGVYVNNLGTEASRRAILPGGVRRRTQSPLRTGFDASVGATALPHEVRPPAGEFFVAYLHGQAIGCGAVKHHADAPAEIKRMWIAPSARGLGLGRRLLDRLETSALAGGARIAHIETSAVLPEALSLYRSAGWVEVPAFNDEPFADHWLEKALT